MVMLTNILKLPGIFQSLYYSMNFCLRTYSYLNLLALLDSKKHIGICKRQKFNNALDKAPSKINNDIIIFIKLHQINSTTD